MEKRINPEEVKGWGIDADPKNEPTYPMKKYTGDDHNRLNYDRPEPQKQTVEVLHSNERPNLTAVYGTSVPPSGISGALRRHAFKYSEDNYGHWLTLILADRINIIEGIVADIRKGHLPNLFAEKGFRADWKYNRKKTTLKLAAGIAAFTLLVILLKQKKHKTLER